MCLEDDDADGIILIACSSTKPSAEPRSHAEAMRDDPEGWGAAESRELNNHRNNETFKRINRSAITGSDAKRKRLVPLTWVYKPKRSGVFKARLCVVGSSVARSAQGWTSIRSHAIRYTGVKLAHAGCTRRLKQPAHAEVGL